MSNGKDLLGLRKALFLPKTPLQAKPYQPPLHTWEDYKKWVNQEVRKGRKLWYRGHSDATWPLKTTFHRIAEKTSTKMHDYLDLISTDVLYEVSSRLNQTFNLNNAYEFGSYLALLQNHGFPTPLLDWSTSPYVAMYFALRGCTDSEPKCGKVRVFVFDVDLWGKEYLQPRDLRSNGYFVSILRPFAKYNPRQITQNTVYTATNVPDIQTYLYMAKKSDPHVSFFTFSSGIKNDVIRELDSMGINEMTLFPDFDGLCRTMKERYFG